jgi:hypothetical protein
MPEPDRSLDILGTKPVAEAVSTVTTAVTSGAGAFLSKVCLPAAEEFGLLLQDKVRSWRARNATAVAEKAAEIFERLPDAASRHAHPRIVGAILDSGSWADEADVQHMWAGLLATSCTDTGRSQENLIFVNLLAQLTSSEARTLKFACERAVKFKSDTGLLLANTFQPELEELMAASGSTDLHVLDLEVDHLRELGLLDSDSGLSPVTTQKLRLTPSAIALQLHVRCAGHIGSPLAFFQL